MFCRRYQYWDPVCEKIQGLLDDGILQKDSIFYIYLKNSLTFVTDIGDPKLQFQWDPEILQFVESLEYHGHEKTMNLLRGPGFLGTGKGGAKKFDWTSWNWPFPGRTTRKKNCTGYTTDNGIHKCLLTSFLELAGRENSPVTPLIDNETVRVIPVAIQKDGMALKPGMQVDSRQGKIIGTTEDINYKYVKENQNPDPEKLKDVFVTEAECYCATSLDGQVTLPVGVDYIPRKLDGDYTYNTIKEKGTSSEICLNHLKSNLTPSKNGVLQNSTLNVCSSLCNECLEGPVCAACIERGHKFSNPALRACDFCMDRGVKCIKSVVLVFAMDSESRNKAAQDLFDEKKKENSVDPGLSLAQCLPDPVHVGKRMSRQFSNWYLIVNGYRINRVQLRTLRNDPCLKGMLMKHLTVAACRNRDRMDVDSMLEISSTSVRQIIQTNVDTITDTLIPEKFRLYEGNKKGVLTNPSGLCLGPHGQIFVVDSSKGKLFSARLHYPVDVTEICAGLSLPLAVAYRDGVVYVAEYTGGKVTYIDLEGKTVYNPDRMTVKELKTVLKDLKILQSGVKSTKKKDLQQKLSNWIASKRNRLNDDLASSEISGESSPRMSSGSKQKGDKGALILQNGVKEPTALHFHVNGTLFIADQSTKSVLHVKLMFNGIDIRASSLQSIGCHTQVYGLVIAQNLFVASSCTESGGLFRYKQSNHDASGDTHEKWETLPKRLLANNTTDCGKIHGLSFLDNQGSLVFTDVSSKTVKTLSLTADEVQCLAGTGNTGQRDGSKADLYQPTAVCTEVNTVFFCDTAVGKLRMVTKPSGLLLFLENLEKFLNTFGVRNETGEKKKFHPTEAITRVKEVNDFIEKCEQEVREVVGQQASDRILQGPDGVCSAQTTRDIKLTIQTLERISATLQEISPSLLDSVDLKALTTLVVENLFAEMRQGNDMPLVLQFAHRFSSAVREYIKRITKCSFIYYTSDSSYYSKQTGFLPFVQFPSMPKPCRNTTVTRQHLDEMRTWRAEHGQSVRQQTVRNMTTKDSAGTLPLNCYESKGTDPKPVDFTGFVQAAQTTALDQEIAPSQATASEVQISKGSVVCVSEVYQPEIQPSPYYLARLNEHLYATNNATAKASFFAQDPMLPCRFVETSVVGDLKKSSILSLVVNCQKDDMIVLGDDVYYCLLVNALDSGDTRTVSEATEEESELDGSMQSDDDTPPVATRSGRRSARNKSN